MARTVTFTQSGGRTPYIYIYIGSTDYSSRLLYLEHHEEAYRDRAIIGLSNRDNSLDTLDLDGKEFEIGYGYGGQKVDTATLWVKSHQIISVEGERIYQIYAEGMWSRMREQRVIAGVTGNQNVLYANSFDASHTIEGLMELVILAFGWTWTAVSNSDGIIDSFSPIFEVNQMPYENAAALMYRLIWMTKSYLRAKPSKTFEAVYPQDADNPDESYYSDQVHYFSEYVEKTILLIPNSIVVLCNQDPSGEWDTDDYPLIVGTAKDQTQIDKYSEIVQPFTAGNIRTGGGIGTATTLTNANNRAAAILTKIQSEMLAGYLVVPHDARVELYDKVKVFDSRT